MTTDIYGREDRIADAFRLLKNSNLSQKNKKSLRKFGEQLMAEDLSDHKIYRYLQTMRVLEPEIDFELEEADKQDIIRLVGKINQNQIPGRDYAPESKAEIKKAIRRFYRWSEGEEEPDIVDFVSTTVKKSKRKKLDPGELPTAEQVTKIVDNCKNCRDKAAIATLWESGARIGELLNLDWSDVKDEGDMIKLDLDGKTGQRTVPVYESADYLRKWKSARSNAEGAVFTSLHHPNRLSYGGFRKQLTKAAERAGVDCKINPHAFRKSRATFLASNGANIFQLMNIFGWTQADTAKVYVRLAQRDVDNLVTKVAGSSSLSEEAPEEPDEEEHAIAINAVSGGGYRAV